MVEYRESCGAEPRCEMFRQRRQDRRVLLFGLAIIDDGDATATVHIRLAIEFPHLGNDALHRDVTQRNIGIKVPHSFERPNGPAAHRRAASARQHT